jgi:adenosylcobyric acid synthase
VAKALMVQGTGSHVGKSVLVTALCRIFHRQGYRVAPFKAQNMALNSFVTRDGGEMGRAQVVQAEAAGREPTVDMNPVLIKPQTDIGAQVIIHGKVVGNFSAVEYHNYKQEALNAVRESYNRLKKSNELIVIEGAGSPAEINLKKNDIVNMRVARMAHAPVILVADIDRGGVFASLVGTMHLLTPRERAMVKGFVINKFRGDRTLLTSGLRDITRRTGVKVLGVVPYFKDIYIPDEDSIALEKKPVNGPGDGLAIAVIKLPHISNFTDFDPLEREPGVTVHYIEPTDPLGDHDVLIIPGSKNTIEDLNFLKRSGYVEAIKKLQKKGTTVVGICGGFQMLGRTIKDPGAVETTFGSIEGLGLLNMETVFSKKKATFQVEAEEMTLNGEGQSPETLRGYEIHMGRTKLMSGKPLFNIIKKSGRRCSHLDGAVSEDGKVWGTYMHGIFDNDGFRRRFIGKITKGAMPSPGGKGPFAYGTYKESQFDALADLVTESLDMNYIRKLTGL